MFLRSEARSEDDGVVAALRRGRTTQPQAEETTLIPTRDFRIGSRYFRKHNAVIPGFSKNGVCGFVWLRGVGVKKIIAVFLYFLC